jgi:hypothetical protein
MSETDTTAMKPGTSTPFGALRHVDAAIAVPAITLEGDANGEGDADGEGSIGHNLPQEAPQAFATAVVDVDGF